MSNPSTAYPVTHTWGSKETFAFRTGFLFLLLLSIPWDPGFYKSLFTLNADRLQQLYEIGYAGPFANTFGLFSGWLIAAVLAIAGAAIWTNRSSGKALNYDQLFYFTRVVLRYRLAWAFIGSGLVLLLPFQLPAPSISDLHTAYGDFLPWKIYYHSTAVSSAGYRQTLGAFELFGAILLLFRRTAAIGALLIAFLLGNIVLVNFAYDLGSQVYSSYLLLVALFLLIYDFPRFYAVLVTGSAIVADRFRPETRYGFYRWRTILKGSFLAITLLLTGFAFARFSGDNWPYPQTPGLAGASGYYQVDSFQVNGKLIPPSYTDDTRWRDVVFEKWNTFSIRYNQPHQPPPERPQIAFRDDTNRNYEWIGNGGRNFYRYTVSGDSILGINPANPADKMNLRLQRPDEKTITLQGSNTRGDQFSVTLHRVNKKYLLYTGRRKPVSI
ncbi:hypothetical protein [Flavihumibacter petaseus]|uniref:DoxX family protein n=1 Tax=Flavihumibacter petaseus NBRC 106054 TaxID=1220578 RepID=A0A0E9MZG2_9BACT|nr:hypothetical protein [Flavihumibacter petaseus]GAO42495.1 hypothetical protein FPE01S_01_15090 [Flavihumibacter petaseus NBRC 106054]